MMPANLLLPSRRPDRTGFTLIELLTAMAVLGLLMLTVFSISNQASKAWLLGEHRTETFQAARLEIGRAHV